MSRRTIRRRPHPAAFWLLLALCLGLACVRPPAVVPPPSPPVVPPPPWVELPPVELTPAETTLSGPILVRVGLATDLGEVTLPCCDERQALHVGDEPWPLSVAIRVTAKDTLVKEPVYRLQVAALKDERQAQGIAQYLSESTGQPADAVFDADTDLYKVRYGRFADRADAEPERERLAGLGLSQAWVTSEGGTLEDPGFVVDRGGKRFLVHGRWLEVSSPADVGLAVAGGRYRGRILLYLNDRGLLNVINELDLEEYLRGVVPKEMGPELFNQLEALKAQTVAARTYVLRNLGEFSNEGYDICSTPRCQVYGGMAVEHRRSDQAIAETEGQVVLYGGEPAETFYGSTCGGHTEDVEVVFPLKRGDYLKGVPCMEAGVRRIAYADAKGPFPAALDLDFLRRETVHFLEVEDDGLEVRTDDGPRHVQVPPDAVTFSRRGEALAAAPLEVAAGDRLELYWHLDRVVALVQPVEARQVSLARHAPKQRWSRFMSQRQLKEAVERRYPGFPFEGFEVLSRGVSGRVGKLRLLGSGGRRVLVEGLAVRWTLDVPDTLFEATFHDGGGRRAGWTFNGRGWGHGVGMCQTGAYGMATRHLDYREILEHYYSGVELGVVRQVRVHTKSVWGP